MKAIIMPKFGFTQETSQIVSWKVKEGDQVEAGDILAEVTTDKITMEVESPETGVVAGIRYKAGDTVPVTEVIAYILKQGESLPAAGAAIKSRTNGTGVPMAATSSQPSKEKNQPEPIHSKITPLAARVAAAGGLKTINISGSGPGGRITRRDVDQFIAQASGNRIFAATPAARRVARESGIALERVRGSGPNGRIQAADVHSFSESESPWQPTGPDAGAMLQREGIRKIPLAGMRKAIAMNMALAWQTIPAIQLEIDIDMEKTMALWEQAKARAGEKKVSLTAFIVKAVAWALTRHPMVNSQLDLEEILLLPDVNIGLAVAIKSGLIVPVIHQADRKAILELADEINFITERARQGKLRSSDLEGATFTISNLGMFGIDRFTAIINPPQVGILAVSAVRKQFVPNEMNQPILHSMMNMRLSADHRVVDGANAARFLSDLRAAFEHPEEMLL